MVASPIGRALALVALLVCLNSWALGAPAWDSSEPQRTQSGTQPVQSESQPTQSESQLVESESQPALAEAHQEAVRFELEVIRPGLTAVSIFRGGYADWVLFVRFGDENTEEILVLETNDKNRAVISLGESSVVLEPTLLRMRIAGLTVSRQEGAVILVSGWPEKKRPRVRGIGRISSGAERAPKPAAELYQASVDLRGKIQYMR